MLLGLASAGVAAWAAGRMASSEKRETALVTFILIAVNCYQSHFTTVVKTYALAALLLAAGFLFLSWKGSRHGLLSSVLAGVFLALAAGTRISLAVLLPIVPIWLLLHARQGRARHEWLGFFAGATITLAILFLPFILSTAENFIFFNFSYHAARDAGGILPQLIYKAGFLSRWAAGYAVAFLIALALLLARMADKTAARRTPRIDRGKGFGTGLLWICAAAVTLVHLAAPFPYDDYQVAVFPLFAIALAVGGVRLAFDTVKSRVRLRYCLS